MIHDAAGSVLNNYGTITNPGTMTFDPISFIPPFHHCTSSSA